MTHGHEHDGTVNKSRDEKSAYTARRTLHSFHDTGACQNTRPKARRGSIVFWSFPPRYFVTPVASKGVNATMIDEQKNRLLERNFDGVFDHWDLVCWRRILVY